MVDEEVAGRAVWRQVHKLETLVTKVTVAQKKAVGKEAAGSEAVALQKSSSHLCASRLEGSQSRSASRSVTSSGLL